jgi:hypothetical protein
MERNRLCGGSINQIHGFMENPTYHPKGQHWGSVQAVAFCAKATSCGEIMPEKLSRRGESGSNETVGVK